MTPEEREQMRERLKNMPPEERDKRDDRGKHDDNRRHDDNRKHDDD
jgi:hypothetical protein